MSACTSLVSVSSVASTQLSAKDCTTTWRAAQCSSLSFSARNRTQLSGLKAASVKKSIQKRKHQRNITASIATDEVASLESDFGGEGVKVEAGEGGLTRITLSTPGGSTVEVYLYGAVATSWKLPSGEDLLFVRPDAVFNGTKPISGGIPHCFPQFGPGKIQQHGFARNSFWELADSKAGPTPSIVLKLVANEYTRSMWEFEFEATFTITLEDGKLSTVFDVKNVDSKPFDFNAALHSYFRADISGVKVEGLKGLTFLNKDPDPTNPTAAVEERDVVTFPGFVDSVYLGTPAELVLDNGLGTSLSISNKGWNDAVLWNPHLTMEACYKDFVCVENAKIEPVTLNAGESWTAEQVLSPK